MASVDRLPSLVALTTRWIAFVCVATAATWFAAASARAQGIEVAPAVEASSSPAEILSLAVLPFRVNASRSATPPPMQSWLAWETFMARLRRHGHGVQNSC